MADSEFCKSFVRSDGTAVLTCPACNHQKLILGEPFKGYRHKLKARCLCKHAFMVFLEFRRRPRKRVLLPGTFTDHTQNNYRDSINILDISLIGLTFSSPNMPIIKDGDEVSIELTLDDKHKTEIRRDAIVRSVRPTAVGCEFENTGGVHDSILGHYVVS